MLGSREHGIIIPIEIPYGAFFSALLVALPQPGHKSAKAHAGGCAGLEGWWRIMVLRLGYGRIKGIAAEGVYINME